MDLKTGWDFSRREDREATRRYRQEAKPTFIIGFLCRMFSQLQNMNSWTQDKIKLHGEDVENLKFMTRIYKTQCHIGVRMMSESVLIRKLCKF